MAFEGTWLLSSSLEEYTEGRAFDADLGCFAAGVVFFPLARNQSDWGGFPEM